MTLHANVSDAVCLVTGANTGIGRHTALELAGGGARVLLACRSREKTAPVVEELREKTGNPRVDLLELDLGSLESVRRCATAFYEQHDRLDLLVNNAGVAGHRGATADGFELQFGTNHIGHFALTCLLRPALLASPAPRVVTVASRGHYRPTTIDFDAVRRPTATMAGFHEYCVSKLANVLFTQELARRTAGRLGAYALHPGVVASDIWRRVPWPLRKLVTLFMVTNEEGAQTTLYCATSPEVADHSGRYYDRSREKRPSRHATPELAAELWRRSVEWTGTDWG
ncbi:MAG: short-chain dehydrogenase [Myxococcales bacterium]